MIFKYRARTRSGEPVEGLIEGESQEVVVNELKARDLIIIYLTRNDIIKNKNNNKSGFVAPLKNIFYKMQRISTIPLKLKVIFMRQFALMIESGISIASALEIIIEQEKNLRFKDIISDIKDDIDQGVSLSSAMKDHAGFIFGDLVISIIKAGEDSGTTANALNRAANMLEKQNEFKNKVKQAMLYPVFVIIFAACVFAAFIIYIIPGFKQVFRAMQIELPPMTEFLLSLGDKLAQNSRTIIITLLIFIILFFALTHSKKLRPLIDRLKLKIPIIKNLVFKSAMARSTRTLSALTSAGVPVLTGLDMAGDTAGNIVIENAFKTMARSVQKGMQLGEASIKVGIFSPLVSQMMRIGSETGRLDNMMDRVASWYDQELSGEIRIISSMLEPVMIIIVGIIIGVMIISLIGPVTSAMTQI